MARTNADMDNTLDRSVKAPPGRTSSALEDRLDQAGDQLAAPLKRRHLFRDDLAPILTGNAPSPEKAEQRLPAGASATAPVMQRLNALIASLGAAHRIIAALGRRLVV